MIGSIKLTGNYTARSGFKYIRFEPGLSFLPEANKVVYKNETYEYGSDLDFLYVEFHERDIKRETMSAIILHNCKILNCFSALINLNPPSVPHIIVSTYHNLNLLVYNQLDPS